MAATGYGVSVLVHLLVLVVLSLIVISASRPDEPSITSAFSNHEVTEFVEVEDVRIEPVEPSESNNPADLMKTATPAAEMIDTLLKADSPGESDVVKTIASGAGFQMPGGGRAVSKGSFTAWTVPQDPAPREDYFVVIQIRLPEKIRKYRKEDLSGFLKGDDGYETPLGDFTGRGFPKQFYGKFDNKARQFVIRIPGGAAKVRDTIEIRSKVLREEQSLEITF